MISTRFAIRTRGLKTKFKLSKAKSQSFWTALEALHRNTSFAKRWSNATKPTKLSFTKAKSISRS